MAATSPEAESADPTHVYPAEQPAAPGVGLTGPWPDRLAAIETTLREMSLQPDPQKMVLAYGQRLRHYFAYDGLIALSRRGLESPAYRITRFTGWPRQPDPWREREKLPVFKSGVLSELIYGDSPRLINDFTPDPADPAFEYLKDVRSLAAMPHFDGGVGLNMALTLRNTPNAFDPERFPEIFWLSNLFGRATASLAMARELGEANKQLDREARVIADIQRSLLPAALPQRNGLDLAAYYQTSKNAGGDLYDFFHLPDGRLGMLIADVSGHGTPAAVVMAILHAIAHTIPSGHDDPAQLMAGINATLTARYTSDGGTFVTAFYGIFDPRSRSLTFTSAGHNPPLVHSARRENVTMLGSVQSLPLGILADTVYKSDRVTLEPRDTLLLYTDGITEARNRRGTMYTEARLVDLLSRCAEAATAQETLDALLIDVDEFVDGTPAGDDRTILVAKVR